MAEGVEDMINGLITHALSSGGGSGGSARLQHDPTFTYNGTFYPDTGYDGFDMVTVNIPEFVPSAYYEDQMTRYPAPYSASGTITLNDGFTCDYTYGIDPYAVPRITGVMYSDTEAAVSYSVSYGYLFQVKYGGVTITSHFAPCGRYAVTWKDVTHMKTQTITTEFTAAHFVGFSTSSVRSMITVKDAQTISIVADVPAVATMVTHNYDTDTETTTTETLRQYATVGFANSDLRAGAFVKFVEDNGRNWTIA